MSNIRRSVSFALSPKKRQSLGFSNDLTPANSRQSLSGNGIPGSALLDIAQNNDLAEKKARQLTRLQQLQSKIVTSPAGADSPADRRRSLNAVAGFTNQQLADHYATCIQLSTENKISVKNAFNLQLIDYMTEMLHRKDSDMNNFQVASYTLDASTKIYGYRVDSIHTDTLKMVGGLGRTKDPNEESPDTVDGETNEVVKKKKKKRGCTIETNLKNLDMVTYDVEFDIDPLFFKMMSQFDEGQSGGRSFLNSLPILDDTCQLLLDSDTVLCNLLPASVITSFTHIPKLPDMDKLISPTFATFEFKNFDLNESIDEVKKKLNLEDDHAFNMDAIPEPLDVDMNDIDLNDDAPPLCMEDDEDNENTAVTVGGGACHDGGGSHRMQIINMKEHLAMAPLEYSYFNSKIMSAWAGPTHWNLRPLIKDLSKLNMKSKGKKKKELYIDYADDPSIEKLFKVTGPSTELTELTIKKWTIENTTLPVDLHYDHTKLSCLYLRDSIVKRAQKSSGEVQTLDDSITNYNYDNQNDEQNYCPDVGDTGGNYDDCNRLDDDSGRFSQTINPFPAMQDQAGDFFGDNLVSVPNKVAKINIGYARTAKKMDMKKLKSIVWTVLTHPVADKENNSANLNVQDIYKENMDSFYNVNFKEVYQDLTPRLSIKMAENLTVPLAFVALLHLANDHNLKLTTLIELEDFQVTQG